ncbi:SPOR domain-containing protein [Yoonia sp. MH D7]
MGQRYNLSKYTGLSVILIAAMGLAACDENGQFIAAENTPGAPSMSQSTELVERDVEAPDVFQITEQGLWDGRPSLGGVWVAHPSSQDPERVIVRNEANGKFVIGALFRRERENPGPALQVSSDAAEALGLLAGAPATLNVTALRREEAAVAAAPEATVDFGEPEDIAATPLDPIAGAAAAIETAAASTPVATPPPAAPTPAPAATSSSLSKPFIQIGIFSVETNARSTADRLRSDGLSSQVFAQKSQGKPFWRVIVGPAPTSADRAAALAKVKTLGFADAYFVTN